MDLAIVFLKMFNLHLGVKSKIKLRDFLEKRWAYERQRDTLEPHRVLPSKEV